MYNGWERWTEVGSHVQAYGNVHDFDKRNFGMTISRYRGSVESKSLRTQVMLDSGGVFEGTHDQAPA